MRGWLSSLRIHAWVLSAGILMGIAGALLAYLGNPVNSGICISCFFENAAGAIGLHANPRMQYLRPELLGFFLGSFGMAVVGREFHPRDRGNGLLLIGFGVLMAVGCGVFIGCPIKAVLRLSAGDLTSVAGLAGLLAGVWGGTRLLRGGELGVAERVRSVTVLVPAMALAVALLLLALSFIPDALARSRVGAGAEHAPFAISLGIGLLLGAVCQRSRFCITGSIRDILLTRSPWPAWALGGVLSAALLANFFAGQFHVGYYDQPGAHLDALWSALGMGLVGVVAVLAGGCPFRQIIRAGQGEADALAVVLGMLLGGALVQVWGLGATAAGVTAGGKVAVLTGLAAVFTLPLFRTEEQV